MQMYLVTFRTTNGKTNETGRAVVNAADHEAAKLTVLAALNLPGSRTQLESERVKVNFVELERKVTQAPQDPRPGRSGISAADYEPPSVWSLDVRADVSAHNEAQAWKSLSWAVSNRASSNGTVLERHVLKIDMMATPGGAAAPRLTPTEKQAIYTETRVFAGGAARPK